MEERQVIKKIKTLKEIKPNKDWVCLSKEQILEGMGGEEEKKYPSLFFMPIRRPALVVAPLVVVAAVLGGLFVYFNFLPQAQPIISQPFPDQKTGEAEEVVASLQELQESLEKITLGLNNLKKAKDQNQALVMAAIIKATAKNGEEIVGQIKSLASLGDAYRELEEKAGDTQIDIMGDYIEDLSQTSLSQENEVRLEEAREYYEQGKYDLAQFYLQQINNN